MSSGIGGPTPPAPAAHGGATHMGPARPSPAAPPLAASPAACAVAAAPPPLAPALGASWPRCGARGGWRGRGYAGGPSPSPAGGSRGRLGPPDIGIVWPSGSPGYTAPSHLPEGASRRPIRVRGAAVPHGGVEPVCVKPAGPPDHASRSVTPTLPRVAAQPEAKWEGCCGFVAGQAGSTRRRSRRPGPCPLRPNDRCVWRQL